MANGGQGISPQGLLAVIWTLASVSTVLLAGRILIRSVLHRRYHADDIFAVLAWVFMMAGIALATASNPLSYRVTSVIVGEADMPPMQEFSDMNIELKKYIVATQVMFWSSIFAVKLSFMFLYRLLVANLQHYKRAWYGALVYIIISYGVCLIGVFGQCIEAKNLFNPVRCASPSVAEYSSWMIWVVFAFNVSSDLIVVAIPLPLIYGFNLRTPQKLALFGVCSLAFITIAFEVVRTVKLSQLNFNLTNLYSYLELLVATIISTLPTYSFAISSTEKSKEYRRLLWSRLTLASYRSNSSNHSIELDNNNPDAGFRRDESSVKAASVRDASVRGASVKGTSIKGTSIKGTSQEV